MVVALSHIWHYWLGVFLFIATLAVVLGVIVGYLVKVQSLKYPRSRR